MTQVKEKMQDNYSEISEKSARIGFVMFLEKITQLNKNESFTTWESLKKLLGASLTLALLVGGILTTSQPTNAHIKCPIKVFGETNDMCPHPPHSNPLSGLAEEAWGEAGRIAYQGAASIMSKRSPTGEPLDASLKDALRPHFGGLVDRVTLHWGTPGLDKWSANQIGINLSGTESAAQTYGHDIYIEQQKPSSYSQGLVGLIIHEMTHSQQYENYSSSLSNFGYNYFKKYKQAGQSYENNELEKKAYQQENNLTDSVYTAFRSPKVVFSDAMCANQSQTGKNTKPRFARAVIWRGNNAAIRCSELEGVEVQDMNRFWTRDFMIKEGNSFKGKEAFCGDSRYVNQIVIRHGNRLGIRCRELHSGDTKVQWSNDYWTRIFLKGDMTPVEAQCPNDAVINQVLQLNDNSLAIRCRKMFIGTKKVKMDENRYWTTNFLQLN
ncbi:DUF4157 domain-containing protein [Crocosphaera chwakensis]|uniref:DUF4157 domain-containing protein n=1 Tax=Crocosphaera chwakensis CCY0110 TaxID=391612 RepID=A3IXK3_9CHRO|nr:DUF4157 domain-containing protein [Crocosphaera chwakensis]EAZ88805.1 hypothetical protein CY0110_01090 [Crocosphaera chwakensis CCY0110]